MTTKGDLPDLDPRGLLFEAYRIEGITGPDCRSIFLDWALGLEAGHDMREAVAEAHGHYQPMFPDHPMTAVLAEGLPAPAVRRRRKRP